MKSNKPAKMLDKAIRQNLKALGYGK